MTVMFQRATWSAALFMVIYLFAAVVWASVIITLLALGVALLPIGVGLPMLVATLSLARVLGGWDRRLANRLLGASIAAPPLASAAAQKTMPADASWWRRTATMAGDASSWRHVAWITAGPVTAAIGFTAVVVAVTVAISSMGTIAVAIWSLVSPPTGLFDDFSAEQVRMWGWIVLAAGGLLMVLTPGFFWLVRGCGAALRAFAGWALGPSQRDQLAAATARAERAEAQVRIDQELHDSIGHMITMTVVQAGAAAHVFDSDPAFAREALRTIEERGRAAMGDLDRIIATIQGNAPTSPLQGAESLDALIADAQAAGVHVTAHVDLPDNIPASVGRAVYSTVREVLTNAARHAPGAAVSLDVSVEDGSVHLVASNPLPRGKAKTIREGGQGIGGMRDRIEVLGGTLDAKAAGGTFVVEGRIPVAGADVASSPEPEAKAAANTRKGKR